MAGRFQVLLVLLMLMAVGSRSPAAPRLKVSTTGPTPGGTIQWHIAAAPDPDLFSDTADGFGGSLDIELGLEVATGSLVNAAGDPTWHDIPSYNPFTRSVTVGTQADASADVVFTSMGSDLLTSGSFVPVLMVETTASSGASLSWGGQAHWPGLPYEFVGGRITQAGVTFDAIMGSLAWSPSIPGDYNGNGFVEQGDLDLVLLNWGVAANPWPNGWAFDLPSGAIDQYELDGLLLNWGKARASVGADPVPEPSAAVLLAMGLLTAVWRRRERLAQPTRFG